MLNRRIAIVGAGVAGTRLAYLLARHGIKTQLFDHKAPWEKPCGGGLTAKVFNDFTDINRWDLNGRANYKMSVITPFGRRIVMTIDNPIVTVSRMRLGNILLDEAIRAGVKFLPYRVKAIQRRDDKIILHTADKEYEADFVVGADGIHSIVRKTFASPLSRDDYFMAYGALLREEVQMPIVIKFYKGYNGYAWIFPRFRETSVGIVLGKNTDRAIMLTELQSFVNKEWSLSGLTPPSIDKPYARAIPSMRRETFLQAIQCGGDWALLGDASGAADPLTGEGLYYAFRTAEILTKAIVSNDIDSYNWEWNKMADISIGKVSKVVDLFYDSRTLRIMGFIMDYSQTARELIGEIISGIQGYDTLRSRMKDEAFQYVKETIWNLLAFKRSKQVNGG